MYILIYTYLFMRIIIDQEGVARAIPPIHHRCDRNRSCSSLICHRSCSLHIYIQTQQHLWQMLFLVYIYIHTYIHTHALIPNTHRYTIHNTYIHICINHRSRRSFICDSSNPQQKSFLSYMYINIYTYTHIYTYKHTCIYTIHNTYINLCTSQVKKELHLRFLQSPTEVVPSAQAPGQVGSLTLQANRYPSFPHPPPP